jgi:hypothetical protein
MFTVEFHGMNRLRNLRNVEDTMYTTFDTIVNTVKDRLHPSERMQMEVNHPALRQPIYFNFKPHARYTGGVLMEKIAAVHESVQALGFDDNLSLSFLTLNPAPAGGRGAIV